MANVKVPKMTAPPCETIIVETGIRARADQSASIHLIPLSSTLIRIIW